MHPHYYRRHHIYRAFTLVFRRSDPGARCLDICNDIRPCSDPLHEPPAARYTKHSSSTLLSHHNFSSPTIAGEEEADHQPPGRGGPPTLKTTASSTCRKQQDLVAERARPSHPTTSSSTSRRRGGQAMPDPPSPHLHPSTRAEHQSPHRTTHHNPTSAPTPGTTAVQRQRGRGGKTHQDGASPSPQHPSRG